MPALLNTRHEAVALALAAGKNGVEAHAAAGYTGKTAATASAVVNRPDVKARVQELLKQQHDREIRSNERAIERAAIEKDWIVQRAKYAVELGLRGGRPVLDKNGHPIPGRFEGRPNINGAVKALALLAQMGGYLVQRHEIGGPGSFARMTDEELNGELVLIGESIGIDPKTIQKAIEGRSE